MPTLVSRPPSFTQTFRRNDYVTETNVEICKKIGQPDYGSLGASCNVEVELDQSLIFDDLDAFQERVMHAYTACREAFTSARAGAWQRTPSRKVKPSHHDATRGMLKPRPKSGANAES
jgi:hypothetical protein